MTEANNIVRALRDFAEMPFEGGAVDPAIEVMQSLGRKAADEIERLQAKVEELQDYSERLYDSLVQEAKEA